jgi:hypothetical protein
MLRAFWGIIAGGVAGIVTMMILESAGDAIFPAGVDLSKAGASLIYMDRMPMAAKVMVLLGWAFASFLASALALRLGHSKNPRVGWAAGAAVFLAGILSLAMIPHPWWMWAVGLPALALPAWFAARQLTPRPADMRRQTP